MTGIFTLVLGDDETKRYLNHGDYHVERMMLEVTGDIADHAAEELRLSSPGRIKELAGHDEPVVPEPGVIEAVAGIEPEITEDTFERGLGSDPADFPVYVEVGTGEFGPEHRPIVMPPGIIMVFELHGQKVFATKSKGQEPQRYAERAYEETLGWVPARLQQAHLPGNT